MTLEQMKFQRVALQEQIELLDFRIARMVETQCTEQQTARDVWLKSNPQPNEGLAP